MTTATAIDPTAKTRDLTRLLIKLDRVEAAFKACDAERRAIEEIDNDDPRADRLLAENDSRVREMRAIRRAIGAEWI
jgi:hypothetical protein